MAQPGDCRHAVFILIILTVWKMLVKAKGKAELQRKLICIYTCTHATPLPTLLKFQGITEKKTPLKTESLNRWIAYSLEIVAKT